MKLNESPTGQAATRLHNSIGNSYSGNDLVRRAPFLYKLTTMEENKDNSLDEDFPLGDGTADMEAVVICPYCGEEVEITVDPGVGTKQAYVEDCPVCCSPWMVHVQYSGGDVSVSVEQTNA